MSILVLSFFLCYFFFMFDRDDKFYIRVFSGVILLFICAMYIIREADNASIEFIMLSLVAFLVGSELLNGRK